MMNRRDVLLAAASALGGVMIGTPTLRTLAGETPSTQASRAVFTAAQSRLVAAPGLPLERSRLRGQQARGERRRLADPLP